MKYFNLLTVLIAVPFSSAVCAEEGPHIADNAPVDCAFETTTTDLFGVIDEKSPEAMKSWPEAKARFLSGLPDEHSLFVTLVLVDQEQRTEYVFLAVDDISDEVVSGHLWTEVVVVEGFQFGDRFSVDEEAISDWLVTKPDGTEDGNLIGKYLDTLQQCAHLRNSNAVSLPAKSDSEGYYFDCDVPSGNVSEWHGPIELAETVRVSGTVEVVKLRHDKRWWPVGSIFLTDLGDENIGLQVYVDWRDTDTFLLGLHSGERKQFAKIPLTDEFIPFEFSLTRAGLLTATIAGYSESAKIDDFDARRIALSCSSGQFTFRDIHVQYE